MGQAGESKMTNHQQKALNIDALKEFRNRFELDIPDNKLEQLDFYKPDENSKELNYLRKKRKNLGGFIPQRKFENISTKQTIYIVENGNLYENTFVLNNQ